MTDEIHGLKNDDRNCLPRAVGFIVEALGSETSGRKTSGILADRIASRRAACYGQATHVERTTNTEDNTMTQLGGTRDRRQTG